MGSFPKGHVLNVLDQPTVMIPLTPKLGKQTQYPQDSNLTTQVDNDTWTMMHWQHAS